MAGRAGFLGRWAGTGASKGSKGLESVYRSVGGIGNTKGVSAQAIRDRGRRRTLIGGGAIAGLGLMGQSRTVGISSGANGVSPGSSGGYA